MTPDGSFQLHPKLDADCVLIGDGALSRVLLMNDRRFPWLILVPRVAGLRDFHDVPSEFRSVLYDEIDNASRVLVRSFNAEKINVAALGNQVPQLHVHVIARFESDAAWPGPVWGVGSAEPYDSDVLDESVLRLRPALVSSSGAAS